MALKKANQQGPSRNKVLDFGQGTWFWTFAKETSLINWVFDMSLFFDQGTWLTKRLGPDLWVRDLTWLWTLMRGEPVTVDIRSVLDTGHKICPDIVLISNVFSSGDLLEASLGLEN